MPTSVCHVVHLVYRFTTGGLENVVAQLINHLPPGEFRHTVIAVTEAEQHFIQRIKRSDVEVISLGKPPGQPFRLYPKAYRLLRRLKPDVIHTCNLAALEFMPMAALAGVPLRVHAEHGMDMGEISGKASRYIALRKIYKHFVHEMIAVSAPLHSYLGNALAIDRAHLHLIPNGVDTVSFQPRRAGDAPPEGFPFQTGNHWVIGMVGRLVPIKNPLLLVDAFVSLAQSREPGTERMRLAIVGDGPLDEQILARMRAQGLEERLWLPGVRADVADILRAMDCFVLPSLSEGTSCTLQEAMASGLAIVATEVGGNADLLEHGRCGHLVPSGDAKALAKAIMEHHADAQRGGKTGLIARESVIQRYGLSMVVQRYRDLFLGIPGSRS